LANKLISSVISASTQWAVWCSLIVTLSPFNLEVPTKKDWHCDLLTRKISFVWIRIFLL
jgi:hypothetical protein